MRVVPLSIRQANELVARLHRHHKPVRGHRFSLGLEHEGRLVGAVIVGRPVARACDQWRVAEVTRLVTDGSKNACSMLYGAAARVAKEMGFLKIQTYILAEEPGTSLIASGWLEVGQTSGGSWNRPSRGGRREDQPLEPKRRFEKMFRR